MPPAKMESYGMALKRLMFQKRSNVLKKNNENWLTGCSSPLNDTYCLQGH